MNKKIKNKTEKFTITEFHRSSICLQFTSYPNHNSTPTKRILPFPIYVFLITTNFLPRFKRRLLKTTLSLSAI